MRAFLKKHCKSITNLMEFHCSIGNFSRLFFLSESEKCFQVKYDYCKRWNEIEISLGGGERERDHRNKVWLGSFFTAFSCFCHCRHWRFLSILFQRTHSIWTRAFNGTRFKFLYTINLYEVLLLTSTPLSRTRYQWIRSKENPLEIALP